MTRFILASSSALRSLRAASSSQLSIRIVASAGNANPSTSARQLDFSGLGPKINIPDVLSSVRCVVV